MTAAWDDVARSARGRAVCGCAVFGDQSFWPGRVAAPGRAAPIPRKQRLQIAWLRRSRGRSRTRGRYGGGPGWNDPRGGWGEARGEVVTTPPLPCSQLPEFDRPIGEANQNIHVHQA